MECVVTVKTAYVIGSYYGGEVLERQLRLLHEDRNGGIFVWYQLQENPPRGFSTVYNKLINMAFGEGFDRVWICNDDITMDVAGFKCSEQVLADDPTIGVVFPVEIMTDAGGEFTLLPTTGARVTAEEAATEGADQVERLFAGFACACVTRESWTAVGQMDEGIGRGYAEDLDWGLRCWKAGFRVVNYRRAQFRHVRGNTFSRLIRDAKWSEERSRESCVKAQEKWPFLWRENDEQILARLHAWYDEARKERTA